MIPKPSRAAYPCQRLVAPLAGGFIVWLTGILGSALAYRKARRLLEQSRWMIAGVFMVVAVAAVWWSIGAGSDSGVQAAWSPSEAANSPIGVGKGIHPGRVVWVHEPDSTRWDGKTGRWWDETNIDQGAVDGMVSQALRTLTGGSNDAAAWNALFRHFNRTHNRGDMGYQPGEKVVIKINMNQDSGQTWNASAGMPSPQMIHSMLDQLIHVVGVSGADITIYDAARYIGDPIFDKVRSNPDPNFQSVQFVCSSTRNGRVGAAYDPANPVCFADPGVPGNGRAYPPRQVTEAKYLINMALFRAHQLFGITLCGKNHFGSIYWPNHGGWTPTPLHNFGGRERPMGSYNCLVDLIGHRHLGGKTLLYVVDALYGAQHQNGPVIRYTSFGSDWTSSLFLSQDPVAIDSVGLDFLRNEAQATECTGPGVENYLHEGALANEPPSGTFYDPDGDGVRLAGLGVHEHWNNAVERKYSRNRGTGAGIELVTPVPTTANGPVRNLTKGTRYDSIRSAVQDADEGALIVVAPGIYRETVNFSGKNLVLRSDDPNNPAVVAATVIEGGAQAVVFAGGEDINCVLAGFTLTGATQGVYCHSAAPMIRNCRIVDNTEAGIKLWENADPRIVNCTVAGNGGDGLEMWSDKTGRTVAYNLGTIAHCTIVGNWACGLRGGLPIVVNTIVYCNAFDGTSTQINADAPLVEYCDVEGGFAGTGNLDADPRFVAPAYWANPADPNRPAVLGDPKLVWMGSDYHLSPDSPCIDTGDVVITSDLPLPPDLDGQLRPLGLRPDLGVDEYAPRPAT